MIPTPTRAAPVAQWLSLRPASAFLILLFALFLGPSVAAPLVAASGGAPSVGDVATGSAMLLSCVAPLHTAKLLAVAGVGFMAGGAIGVRDPVTSALLTGF
mmetsp:Transcript_23017/g.48967  ORF Transcript_23017/g.48967 Transcript_23017/m.48967 type:complete len:101 (+) Transcript_23017:207-509(+)